MATAHQTPLDGDHRSRRILGLTFFTGTVAEAVDQMESQGGLLVVPNAPGLKDLPVKQNYREALLNADLIITDSGFMVLIWNILQKDWIPKRSGLAYVRELLQRPGIRDERSTLWVMPSHASAERNVRWLRANCGELEDEDVYVAPMYGDVIQDESLLERIRIRRPRHIVITVGGGTQERLGHYLKQNLNYRPAIHCIGAAIAFLTGDQVHIPVWSDKLYLGWLFRCISEPGRSILRYWSAWRLVPLMIRYRHEMPCSKT